MSVYLQVIRRALRAVIGCIIIRAITAKTDGHGRWETVAAFLSIQKCVVDPATGKLVNPHICACLYLADRVCNSHQDYHKESELVILFSMALAKDGVAGNWVFTPLSNEYLFMGPGTKANRHRSKAASRDLSKVEIVHNISHHMPYGFPHCRNKLPKPT